MKRLLGILLAGLILVSCDVEPGHSYSGAGGVWAIKKGAFIPVNRPGTDAGIRDAIEFAGIGGLITYDPGDYVITSPLSPKPNQIFQATGYSITASNPTPSVRFIGNFAGPIIEGGSGRTVPGVSIEGIGFSGSSSLSGSVGIHVGAADGWTIRDCFFDSFADQAVKVDSCTSFFMQNVFAQNAVLIRSGRTDYTGAIEFGNGTADVHMQFCSATPSISSGGANSGYIAGIVLKGSNNFLTNCVGHFGESGIVIKLGSGNNHLIGCRGEFNRGRGFVIAGSTSEYIGCWAFKNSQEADSLYAGFYTTNGQNNFFGCRVSNLSSDTVRHRDGFEDNTNVGTDSTLVNSYIQCRAILVRRNPFQFVGSTPTGAAYFNGSTFTTTGNVTFPNGIIIPYTKSVNWKDSGGNTVSVIQGNGTVTKIFPLESTEIQFVNRADTITLLRMKNGGEVDIENGLLAVTKNGTFGDSLRTNKGLYIGGQFVNKILRASTTLDFDLTVSTCQDLTITVTGAALSNEVSLGIPNGSVSTAVSYYGWVSAANTVTVRCCRFGAGVDPPLGTFNVTVIQ